MYVPQAVLVTEATTEPVTRAELKAHLRVDFTDEDALIDSLIAAARKHCQDRIGQQFINATWRVNLDCFPHWELVLPRSPLSSITTIVYVAADGTSTTLSSSLYTADTHTRPGRVTPAYGQVWPPTRSQTGAVQVTFVAGYGSTATSVPDTIKAAIKLYAAHLYEHREPVAVGVSAAAIPMGIENLLAVEWDGSIT